MQVIGERHISPATGRKQTVRSVIFGSLERPVWVNAAAQPGWLSALPRIPDIELDSG